MATITNNQRSYSNYAALLDVTATAKRTGANTISITAAWSIYTAKSSLTSATRYLVLFIDSTDGKKYYSPAAIRSGAWASETTYSGTVTFTGVALGADETSIKIGFGVSQSNTYMTSSGTFIWNGDCSWTIGTYNPDIQFNTITGIAQGYTACTAPTSFTAPDVFADGLTLQWSGAAGGINNTIEGYTIQCRYSTDKTNWSDWTQVWSHTNDGAVTLTVDWLNGYGIDTSRKMYLQFRIMTRGSAGADYYSGWKTSNFTQRLTPVLYLHNGATAETYGAYVGNGSGADRHTAYVYDGTTWCKAHY